MFGNKCLLKNGGDEACFISPLYGHLGNCTCYFQSLMQLLQLLTITGKASEKQQRYLNKAEVRKPWLRSVLGVLEQK